MNDEVLSGEPASTKLGFHSNFRIRNTRLSYRRYKNVTILVFSLGKFLDVRQYACVKDLTNIISEYPWGIFVLKQVFVDMGDHLFTVILA